MEKGALADEKADLSHSAVQERCTKLFVLTVVRNATFLSNLRKADQFTAKTAIRTTRNFSF
jgi:hypothetical protein